jgi:eukaryotic-like serine/threonine-protein kinase
VYALGVLLFEMLTGTTPFPEDTWDPDAARSERAAPRPRGVSGLPTAVGRLVQASLAYAPARRPTAREVAGRLAAYGRPLWRRRPVLAVAAGPLIAAGVVTAFLLHPADPPGRAVTVPAISTPAAPSAPPSSGPTLTPTPDPTAPAVPPVAATTPPVPPATRSSAPTTGPSAPPPLAAAVLSPDQAIAGLKQVIATGVDQNTIRPDVADDLNNQVESIAGRLTFHPDASVDTMITSLRNNVLARSMEEWGPSSAGGDPNRPPIAASAQTQLLAAINQLSIAVDQTS